MGEVVQDELTVLLEQLDEVIAEPIVDADDAYELAVLAGLAARLGGAGGSLAAAEAWRNEDGAELLAEAWIAFEHAPLIAAVDEICGGDAEDDEIEEAILDVDEAVVAALWCGQPQAVRDLTRAVEKTVRDVPEVFAFLAEDGIELARTRDAAEHPDLYGFWLAIADAGKWAEDEEDGEA